MSRNVQLTPFRMATRQAIQRAGGFTYASGQRFSIELPRTGYACSLFIKAALTQTLSGAGALAVRGPWDILQRITLNTNLNATTVIDVSGYGGFLSGINEFGSRPDRAGVGDTTPNSLYYLAPVASGANVWVLVWNLPIAANNGSNFDTGLLGLQAGELSARVDITCGQPTDGSTLGTATTGTVEVYYLYYDYGDPNIVEQPPLVLHRTLEDIAFPSAVGEFIYQIPRAGVLLNLWVDNVFNAAKTQADSIDYFRIRINKALTPYDIPGYLMKYLNRKQLGTELPLGVFFWQFFEANGVVNQGDYRDMIDTESVTTTEFVEYINSAVTLGASNNSVRFVRRIIQTLDVAQ